VAAGDEDVELTLDLLAFGEALADVPCYVHTSTLTDCTKDREARTKKGAL
jgi:hypothetical protein